jgi:hypothetical protein
LHLSLIALEEAEAEAVVDEAAEEVEAALAEEHPGEAAAFQVAEEEVLAVAAVAREALAVQADSVAEIDLEAMAGGQAVSILAVSEVQARETLGQVKPARRIEWEPVVRVPLGEQILPNLELQIDSMHQARTS